MFIVRVRAGPRPVLFIARSEAAKAAYSVNTLGVGSRPGGHHDLADTMGGWVPTNVRDHGPPV
jgi:hypothetical protein